MGVETKYVQEQSPNEDNQLVNNNLKAILKSQAYQLAHQDQNLMESDSMRGVRMLLEITKPQLLLLRLLSF